MIESNIPLINVPGAMAGIPENPSPIPGSGASGLGDINYSIFFSPKKSGKVTWGIGPLLTLQTATDDQLGTEKWSLGPTAVALNPAKMGFVGFLDVNYGQLLVILIAKRSVNYSLSLF